MPVSTAEKRFCKNWEEQREGGKKTFVGIFTFGLTILVFLCAVALGLFMSLPFVKVRLLQIMGVSSLVIAFLLSLLIWSRQEKRYHKIKDRMSAEAN
jgi:Flp pilus assembly protein TadB